MKIYFEDEIKISDNEQENSKLFLIIYSEDANGRPEHFVEIIFFKPDGTENLNYPSKVYNLRKDKSKIIEYFNKIYNDQNIWIPIVTVTNANEDIKYVDPHVCHNWINDPMFNILREKKVKITFKGYFKVFKEVTEKW